MSSAESAAASGSPRASWPDPAGTPTGAMSGPATPASTRGRPLTAAPPCPVPPTRYGSGRPHRQRRQPQGRTHGTATARDTPGGPVDPGAAGPGGRRTRGPHQPAWHVKPLDRRKLPSRGPRASQARRQAGKPWHGPHGHRAPQGPALPPEGTRHAGPRKRRGTAVRGTAAAPGPRTPAAPRRSAVPAPVPGHPPPLARPVRRPRSRPRSRPIRHAHSVAPDPARPIRRAHSGAPDPSRPFRRVRSGVPAPAAAGPGRSGRGRSGGLGAWA